MKRYSPIEPWVNDLSGIIVDAAYEVHTRIGPGLLESLYEKCLCVALAKRSVPFVRQKILSIEYEGIHIPEAARVDLLVQDAIIVELKAVESLLPIHEAQVLTYLRLTSCRLGLLINFNVPRIRDGIRRLVL